MVENEVNGTVEAGSSNAEEVKTEQVESVQNEAVPTTEETAPATEETAPEPPAPVDPDEKVIIDILESGKEEVSTGELIRAGFTPTRIAQFEFNVGKFKLIRLTQLDPYKIEKLQ